jgi:hypothetical protein
MALCDPCYNLIHDDDGDNPFLRDALIHWFNSNKDSTTEALPQRSRLTHTSWESFCDSLDNYCPICWVVWHHIRDSPVASYRSQVCQRFSLWLDGGHQDSDDSGVLELKYSCETQDSDDIVVKYIRTTKQQFEGDFPQ